ncbi:MAG TPA: 4'-phosphopantetheinyl transferase superfamily protein [Gemmatimonadaceae bacterium]|nr:4'-phosphopantetheinyl transferase superfamily protein [Gemmatimonadaceae bacterium]
MPSHTLSLQPGSIHVWTTRLDAPPDAIASAERTLSPDEHARAARYRGDHLRRRFVLARAAVRAVLARYLGADPAAVVFELGAHGKPRVSGDEPPFSVSHSADVAVIAVSGAGAVGVDVEAIRLIPYLDDLAARNFARAERATLEALPPDERVEAFFRAWTAKEAYVKALGVGLAIPLDAFTVDIERAARVVVHDDAWRDAGDWWTRHFEPCRGYVGAVASPVRDAALVFMGPLA